MTVLSEAPFLIHHGPTLCGPVPKVLPLASKIDSWRHKNWQQIRSLKHSETLDLHLHTKLFDLHAIACSGLLYIGTSSELYRLPPDTFWWAMRWWPPL